jgi:isoleucyl-tRNA synthetase
MPPPPRRRTTCSHASLAQRADGPGVDLLRGPADRQRPAGDPPRRGPGLQGHLPPLPDDEGAVVRRKGGWDCHGLPVELEVEKELGLDSKADIEAYGIEAFNARCRESVLRYVGAFEELTERIGFWIDTDDAYRTMDPDLRRQPVVGAQGAVGPRA